MKKLLSIALISLGLGSLASADTFYLQPGWNLVGSSNSINVAEYFNNDDIKIVWRYENGEWQYYTPNPDVASMINGQYPTFSFTSPNEGFWVYSLDYVTIDTDLPSFGVQDLSNLYSIPLNTINLDDVAGKEFVLAYDWEPDLVYKIDFDENGVALPEVNCGFDKPFDRFEVRDGELYVYGDNDSFAAFKVLAKDDNMIVLGLEKISSDFNAYIPNVIYLLNPDASLTPQDMSSKIPYTEIFVSHPDNYGRIYDENGTIVNTWGYVEGNYTIENGKIVASHGDIGWNEAYTLQTVYSVDMFDLNKVEYNYTDYIYNIGEDINISSIDSFNELLEDTNYTLWGMEFYDENLTTSYGDRYEISDDGKTLTIYHIKDDTCDIYSPSTEIFKLNGDDILHIYQGEGYSLTATAPIYNEDEETLSKVKKEARPYFKASTK